jgi:hypothetical protein
MLLKELSTVSKQDTVCNESGQFNKFFFDKALKNNGALFWHAVDIVISEKQKLKKGD